MAKGDARIRRFYFFRALTSFSLWIPFWTLWVYKNLESLFLLTAVDAAFWATMVLVQVPAGLLGDKYGRKVVLFVGEALFAVGVLTFGLSTEFWEYFVSNIIWALGACFIVSGDTPFVYDTLLELDRGRDFTKVMGTANAVMFLMNAVACITGGIIVTATGRVELTLIIASLIGLTGSFTIAFLREPRVPRTFMKSYRQQLGTGVKQVVKSRAIMILILFQIVLQLGTYVMAVFRSVYMNDVLRLDYLEVGLFFGAFAIVGGIVTLRASRIEALLKEKGSLLFMLVALVSSFAVVFLVRSPAAVLTQFLVYMVVGLQSPVINGYIHRLVDSSHRSTIIAIASMLFTLLVVVVEIGTGWIAELWGLEESVLVLACCVAPIGAVLLILWNREVDKFSRSGAAGPSDVPH
ncbi:MAG: MFS transporter [Candidatus Thermoplasmatota archaeon]